MKGVFLDVASLQSPIPQGGGDVDMGPLAAVFPSWTFYQQTSAEQTAARIQGADVVVSNKVVLDHVCLQQSRDLRLICVAATGSNNIDIDCARRRGIVVANVTGYATASVSEHVFALMLALKRRLPGYQRLVAAGQWQRSHQFGLLDFPITELAGRTLGIVGYGELGQAVARVAEAFGMSVRIASRPGIKAGTPPQAGRVVLNQLLTEADILTLHCPLNDNTRNLIGANELALMKSDAVLINTARGGIVDEQALADALRSGQIGGAAVDVLSQEPPVSGNPLLAADIPNLIVTPHIAWASRESRQRLIHEIAINIRAWMRGEDRNRLC